MNSESSGALFRALSHDLTDIARTLRNHTQVIREVEIAAEIFRHRGSFEPSVFVTAPHQLRLVFDYPDRGKGQCGIISRVSDRCLPSFVDRGPAKVIVAERAV